MGILWVQRVQFLMESIHFCVEPLLCRLPSAGCEVAFVGGAFNMFYVFVFDGVQMIGFVYDRRRVSIDVRRFWGGSFVGLKSRVLPSVHVPPRGKVSMG